MLALVKLIIKAYWRFTKEKKTGRLFHEHGAHSKELLGNKIFKRILTPLSEFYRTLVRLLSWSNQLSCITGLIDGC